MNFAETLSQSGLFFAFLTVFGAGIATSLTPCVYPMIPITLSLFGAKETTSRLKAFLLATAYVMGIAITYAILGSLAAALNFSSGALLANPWIVIPMVLFFWVMASSMFGFWEIRLPAALQAKMSQVGGKGYRGAFLMGMVGGFLIAPCTGPVLAGVLTYVSTTGSILFGASLLFTYALGIGVLFWVLATFAIAMPKSGMWMDTVKSVLGILLVAAGFYFLQNIVVPIAELTSSGKLLAVGISAAMMVAGFAIGAAHLSFKYSSLFTKVRKTLGIVLVSIGALVLINYILTPSSKIPWEKDEAKALALAKKTKKRVFIDFSAKWCVPCRKLEASVLSTPIVRKSLSNWILLKIDLTEGSERDLAFQKKYNAKELPQIILLSSEGKEIGRAGKADIALTSSQAMVQFLKKVKE